MIKTLILDLDGPILDGRYRHYACYQQILVTRDYKPVSFETYWRMKRNRVDHIRQLEASGAVSIAESFLSAWLELIEQPDLLMLDRLQNGVTEKLKRWREQGIRLILATMRRYPERLRNQLVHFGLDTYFDHVVVCGHLDGVGKAQELKRRFPNMPVKGCLWVGDTEADIEAARAFGCLVWAVTCGLRAKSYLSSLSPDFLSPDLVGIDLKCCYTC